MYVARSSAPDPRSSSYRKALTRYLDDLPGQLTVSVREPPTTTAGIAKVDLVVAPLLKTQCPHRGLTGWGGAGRQGQRQRGRIHAVVRDRRRAGPGRRQSEALGLRDMTPGPGGAWGASSTRSAS
ncbi:hypothetical protein ABZ912_10520 [Nonomuraea angiospora]|uniref:hypothetical protein n=1 Tax=Nonomuraea angiospora TaxID=46172 RepID=UPI0033E9920D